MVSGQRVLVVDGLAETEEVLKAVLEPRGLSVERVRGHQHLATTDRPTRPHVVVLHSDDTSPSLRLCRISWSDIPCVVIGSAKLSHERNADDQNHHYLQKPFCYRELIRAIEKLLAGPEHS